MNPKKPINRVKEFEKAISTDAQATRKYFLRLYITGSTERSTRAIQNIRAVCEKYLKNSYELEVIDVHQQPGLAREEQIIAAPTLIKRLPIPLRRIVGDLSDTQRVLVGLDLRIAG